MAAFERMPKSHRRRSAAPARPRPTPTEPGPTPHALGNQALQRQLQGGDASATLLALRQPGLGNRAVQRLLRPSAAPAAPAAPAIQRTIGDGHDLASPRFSGDATLEAAYDNERLIRSGDRGAPVEKIQQALIEAGYQLPKYGPDGIFGGETAGAVKRFQHDHGLKDDGIVGPKTMTALDSVGPKPGPPKPEPPKEEPPLPHNEFVLQIMGAMDAAGLALLRKDTAFLNGIQQTMSEAQFGKAAALLILSVPPQVVNKAAAKQEALRILSAQLGGDKQVARGAIDKNIEVVIVPQDKLMTDLDQFKSLRGQKTFDGREWDVTRGSGGMQVGGKVFTAIAEENLLGVDCTATIDRKDGKGPQPIGKGAYAKGYSTTSHEFAHTLHLFVLPAADKKTITDAYKARKEKAKKAPKDPDQWVDGREGCYASMTEEEFFAQLSNAYLGTNAGVDPFTNDPRHNDKAWVKSHEPTVYAILDRMYAGASLPGTNPRK